MIRYGYIVQNNDKLVDHLLKKFPQAVNTEINYSEFDDATNTYIKY